MNFNARRNIFTCCLLLLIFLALFQLLVRWNIFIIHYENFNIQIDQFNFTRPDAKNDNLDEKFQKRRQFVEQFCQSKGYSDQDQPVKEDDEPSRLFLLEKIGAMFCMFVHNLFIFFVICQKLGLTNRQVFQRGLGSRFQWRLFGQAVEVIDSCCHTCSTGGLPHALPRLALSYSWFASQEALTSPTGERKWLRNRYHTAPSAKKNWMKRSLWIHLCNFLCFFLNAVRVPKAGLETTRETLTPISKQLQQSFPRYGNVDLQISSFSEINNLKEKKIFVTRNPIDRLLSCWHDKLVDVKTQLNVEETCQRCGVCFQLNNKPSKILFLCFT